MFRGADCGLCVNPKWVVQNRRTWKMRAASAILLTFIPVVLLAQGQPIPFGSALEADRQIAESRKLAKDLLSAPNPQLRAKGDQHRTYNFPAANKAMPYRLYVPTTWDGQGEKLPLVLILHGRRLR